MFVSECLKVNKANHLEIGGCDCVELAKEYGTPLYVMDEGLIRNYCRIYKNSMDKYYGGNGLVLYASKAFCTLYMCKILQEEGLGVDVVSGGELYTALKAEFPVEKIYFHGNNKTYDELMLAVQNDIGRIVVDNKYELGLLNDIASKLNKKVKILFRIKPGVEAHTHDFIQTGQIDSKFGVALETGEAMEIVQEAINLSNIELVGLHCHIGSQIFDLDPFKLAAKVMMNFIGDIKDKFGLEIKELNLGGGYGIKYVPEHDPIQYDSYIEAVSKVVKEIAAQRGVQLPFILMEPGRSIVAPAGITLYTVGAVKDIPNVRKYVSVDGGMGDNPRYILYQSEYDAVLANRPQDEKTEKITIAGKCCESGDLLIKDIMMPEIKPGDYLAVLATGGYNYSMASNYNRIPRPPVVMVKDGQSKVVVKRETYEDIIKNDII
ncbi:diaminopimelate decarboxylase [Petroclostridium sp. X23]|uniref:diaminopimelate decarboxylase n=1 Tax=Petroclostridium sp. X23 TaxID=3045146 RepID=UPI0024AE03DD|nr:diaminopimelate decarboxylase [Petroclostridium sp. X23]WHH59439.1 diaminopimelate decarboxylase [Petroclostridium sp. X23]